MNEQQPPQRRGGRVRGAEGYHKEDVAALLQCVRNVVPTTSEEWDQVLDEYREIHAIPNTRSQRDTHSLKVKFKQLARLYKGDEVSRPEIQEAGTIVDLIESKMANGNWLQRRGGRTKGAEGFSPADARAVLDIARRFLPVYRREWEQAAEEYCREYAEPNERISRDGVSLKNKFRSWLKDDGSNMPREEVADALAIQAEIDAKTNEIAKSNALEDGGNVEDVEETELEQDEDERRGEENQQEATKNETKAERNLLHPSLKNVAEHLDPKDTRRRTSKREENQKEATKNESSTSSEGGEKPTAPEPKKRGRAPGSEGYTKTDVQALLACVKEVLPVGPTDWDYVWQLYQANYTTPNHRAPRTPSGIKIKFRQLVNWKQGVAKVVPDTIMEARAIERSIEHIEKTGKRPRSESESNAHFSHPPEARALDSHEKRALLLPRSEIRSNETQRQHAKTEPASWSASPQAPVAEPAAKRSRQEVPNDPESDALRAEIASRELELLAQREQREAEQAAWEKERAAREKQRMDMEAWTVVCDRLRSLFREQSSESNPDILTEIKDEISVLKKKKQRLAGLMI
ncbi:hypothetical protein PHMEG_0002644 [Phytophthora megakarya]|uniref:Uncharacterized protein n=1 Tax=Phytophthora megakarya TaxID=4795 RepID=A0A225X0A5_9STRA|nr:hypothetical protein PHMEG_0002644 [Phytophthora megakarya]